MVDYYCNNIGTHYSLNILLLYTLWSSYTECLSVQNYCTLVLHYDIIIYKIVTATAHKIIPSIASI